MFVSPGSNEPTTAYSCSTVRLACWSAVTELNGLEERGDSEQRVGRGSN